jgi:Protein of unknown function (DUF2917)
MRLMRSRGWREAMQRLFARRDDGCGERCLELELDETWSAVVGGKGLEVRCASGLVMITCEGDPEDHMLSEGSVLVARRPGRLAIWALKPARLRVATADEAASAALTPLRARPVRPRSCG